MLNPFFWLEPFFATPEKSMAEAEAAEQKRSEAMINPVPCFPLDPHSVVPHNRAQALKKVIYDWRADNVLDVEVTNVEIEDLYERLRAIWGDMQIDMEAERIRRAQEEV